MGMNQMPAGGASSGTSAGTTASTTASTTAGPSAAPLMAVSAVVFAAGLAVVLWVAAGYAASSPLALGVLALITAAYCVGGRELWRLEQDTAALSQALGRAPQSVEQLGAWLDGLPASLRLAVHRRIEGLRDGLPGPALTPYLVGLLVLLGMLGTFLGMVVTLKGAVVALDRTSDLPALREALSAPVKGLGLAFGTSVAGVAASAALGLVAALARRHRLQVAQALEAATSNQLWRLSAAHQRELVQQQAEQAQQEAQQQALQYAQQAREAREAQQAQQREQRWQLQQDQARLLPQMVAQMATQWEATMARMAQHHDAMHAQWVAGQERFHQQAQAVHAELAAQVQRSLQEGLHTHLAESARQAGTVWQPAVEATLAGLARQAALQQERVEAAVLQQLEGMGSRLGTTAAALETGWTQLLDSHTRHGEQQAQGLQEALQSFTQTFEQRSTALLVSVGQSQEALHTTLASQDVQRQTALVQALEAQSAQTLAEVARLMDAAAQAPLAAAQAMAQLQQQLQDSQGRDQAMLEERARLMATLAELLQTLNQAATEQRGVLDALLASSSNLLQQVGQQFSQEVQAATAALASAGGQLQAGAIDVASLGETFGFAVQQFGHSSQALADSLQRIQTALGESATRSDEQLAYYVAQARELIDLSIGSQKLIVEDLQRLPRPAASPVASSVAAAASAPPAAATALSPAGA